MRFGYKRTGAAWQSARPRIKVLHAKCAGIESARAKLGRRGTSLHENPGSGCLVVGIADVQFPVLGEIPGTMDCCSHLRRGHIGPDGSRFAARPLAARRPSRIDIGARDQNRCRLRSGCIWTFLRRIPRRLNEAHPMNIVIVFNAESLVAVWLLVRALQHWL